MIELKNIRRSYQSGGGEILILNNVNLNIAKGEFVAIVGPSGSGKSTLMNILGALDRPTGGTYLLNGEDVATLSDDELACIRSEKIGFVFQSFNLLPRSSVIRNVILPLIYDNNISREDRMKRAEKCLGAVGLEPDRWQHLSNQLSGGQMQRVAIARALINEPDIVLADEPTGNLDSKTGQVVLKTFQKINKEDGHTIILITHDQDVAKYASRVIEIKDGMIVTDKKQIQYEAN